MRAAVLLSFFHSPFCFPVAARPASGEGILRINDRGPFGGKFIIDLTRAAAEALGVHASADRGVEIEVLRLPN